MTELALSTITPAPPAKAKLSSEKKWGKPVCDLGFCVIPSLIFKAQARLGLNPTQLAVLLQLADHWWDASRNPYPSKKTLSERLGLSPRQVQRYITELELAGLVSREIRTSAHKGRMSNGYDLKGLVEKLKSLEPEFREVADMQNRVTKKGGLRKGSALGT